VQDDWHVTSKLALNLGLRWEFATPIWDRDNYWSNFNPATNTLVRATNGSLYDRALVNSNYKDFGPRVGFAYSYDSKTSIRGGYGISYDFFNRPGSAIEGINGPLAIFGVINQSFTAGGPVPAGFLTTQNSFTTGVASTFNPINSNNSLVQNSFSPISFWTGSERPEHPPPDRLATGSPHSAMFEQLSWLGSRLRASWRPGQDACTVADLVF